MVYFEKRENFMVMRMATQNLESLAIRLRAYTENFTQLFDSILPNWSGDTVVFSPVEALVNQHFLPRSSKEDES